jgi:hypothetical protein
MFGRERSPVARTAKISVLGPLVRLEDRVVPTTITWSGAAGDNQWLNSQNWQGGVLPTPVDDANIGSSPTGLPIVVNGFVWVHSVSSNQTIDLPGTGTLTLSAATSQFSNLVLDGGLFDPQSEAVLANSQISGPGTLSVQAGRSLALSSTTVAAPLINRGTLVVRGGSSNTTLNGVLTNSPGAILRIQGSNNTAILTVATGFTNQGAIELTSADFNSSMLTVSTGTLTNAVGASISALAGATGLGNRTINAPLVNQGVLFAETGQTLRVAGSLTHSPGGTATGGGTISANSWVLATDMNVGDYAVILDFSGLTVSGPGTFTVPAGRAVSLSSTTMTVPVVNFGTLIARGGSSVSSISGPLTNAFGAILRVQGGNNTAILTVATGFTNQGAIELTSADFNSSMLTVSTGTLTNAVGASISALAGATGLGNRTINAPLVNQGALIIELGMTMRIAGSLTHSSGGTASGGGTLSPNSWTIASDLNLADYTVIVDMSGQTVSGPGTLTVPVGRSLPLSGTVVAAPLINRGTIVARGLNAGSTISGAFSNVIGAVLRVQGEPATLTVSAGFTNQGFIELTSTGFSSSTLSVSNGVLTNASGATISAVAGPSLSGNRTIGGQLSNLGNINVNQSMIYSGSNFSNAGRIAVADGQTLILNGTTTLNNLSGGILLGSGTVSANVNGAGTIQPGAPLGALTVNGNVVLGGLSTYAIGPAIGQYAQLKVVGTAAVGGPLAVSFGFTPSVGSTYRIIDNDGTDPVLGNFAGLAPGGTFTSAGITFQINYSGGTGNDVVLTVTAVAATSVQSVTIDNGTAQRSMVRSVTVSFNRLVTFVQPAAAFQLARTGPGTPTGNVTLAVDLSGSTATQTVARLTFSGAH